MARPYVDEDRILYAPWNARMSEPILRMSIWQRVIRPQKREMKLLCEGLIVCSNTLILSVGRLAYIRLALLPRGDRWHQSR